MTTQTEIRTSTWTIDKTHSSEFDGAIHVDEANPENSSVTATIGVASIDTNVADRDAHLRSDDFFNAEQYPKITFKNTRVELVNSQRAKVHGDLTIRDVTKPVVLDTEYEGQVDDPWGNRRAAFTATTQISRKEFGVKWNQLVETG